MKTPTNHSGKRRITMFQSGILILDKMRVSPELLRPLVKIAHANLQGESRVWDGWKLPGV
jgi:hypothetical protein